MKIADRMRCRGSGAILAAMTLLTPLLRAQAAQPENQGHAGETEIHRLRVADQDDRRGIMGKSKAEWDQVTQRDVERRKRTLEIYRSGGLVTGSDFFDAALILQHGDGPEDYLLAHVLCTIAIAKDNAADARWLSAATLDRYLQSIQQKQIFGTQYESDDQKGYTNGLYDPSLLTDSVRKALEVPTLEEQKKDLANLNKSMTPTK
jgi:hypothetical protein